MKAISLFNDDYIEKQGWLFSYQSLINLCEGHIKSATEDGEYLHKFSSPKWFLTELYFLYKRKGMLKVLPIERQKEIWAESKGDKMLAFSLYLVEVI